MCIFYGYDEVHIYTQYIHLVEEWVCRPPSFSMSLLQQRPRNGTLRSSIPSVVPKMALLVNLGTPSWSGLSIQIHYVERLSNIFRRTKPGTHAISIVKVMWVMGAAQCCPEHQDSSRLMRSTTYPIQTLVEEPFDTHHLSRSVLSVFRLTALDGKGWKITRS